MFLALFHPLRQLEKSSQGSILSNANEKLEDDNLIQVGFGLSRIVVRRILHINHIILIHLQLDGVTIDPGGGAVFIDQGVCRENHSQQSGISHTFKGGNTLCDFTLYLGHRRITIVIPCIYRIVHEVFRRVNVEMAIIFIGNQGII